MATRSTDTPAARSTPATPAPPLPAVSEPGPALDPRLLAELGGPRWEQSWALTPTIHTPAADPSARQRHWTLAEMLHPVVRDAFAMAERRTALDLHCGEGQLAHRLLAWGARRVLALDDRPAVLRRARLLRDHYAIPSAELELAEEASFAEPAPADRFDVVLLTGALERAGDPATLSRAFEATASACAIECPGGETNAVAEAALAAGFGTVDRLRPPLQGAPAYVLEQRDVLVAKVRMGR